MKNDIQLTITFFLIIMSLVANAQKVIILDQPLNESINLEADVTIILKPGFKSAPGIEFNASINPVSASEGLAHGTNYQLNENINWTSATSYNVSGEVISSGIQYFNAFGKPQQSQFIDIKTGKIWANEILYDDQGRPTLNTFSAPITDEGAAFNGINNDFTSLSSSDVASITEDNTNLPIISTQKHKLGWYYSNNNNEEPFQDITNNPYVKTIYSKLNPGAVLKTLGGNKYIVDTLGTEEWKQGFSYTMPAAQEMYYVFGRNYFPDHPLVEKKGFDFVEDEFPSTTVSALVTDYGTRVWFRFNTTFMPEVGKSYRFAEGGPIYEIFDVVLGDPDASEEVDELRDVGDIIPIEFEFRDTGNYYYYKRMNELIESEDAQVITLKSFKTVNIDVHGNESVIFSGADGKVLATARSGGSKKYEVVSVIGKQGYVDVHIPIGIENSEITFLGQSDGYTIYDLRTELPVSKSEMTGGNIYRIQYSTQNQYNSIPDPYLYFSSINSPIYYSDDSWANSNFYHTGGIRYLVNYHDFTLNYYDQAGRLIKSLPPLAFDDNCLNANVQASVNHNTNLASTYEYNSIGQLTKTTSPDEGTAKFKYRKDGQIRFSQNDKQQALAVQEVSYTNYDNLARPIESGVLESQNFDGLDPEDTNLPTTNVKEQHFTWYDTPDITNLHAALSIENIPTSAYPKQNFLAGNVSKTYTSNPSTTTSWYSYDVYGRVTWLVQQIEGLGTKTIDYEYDPVTSEVVKVMYQKHSPSDMFVHKYEYNVAGQLVNVQTSTDNVNFVDQAHYEYYETGALKRIELADNLQGIDYVYNLAGQLKAINSPNIGTSNTNIFRDPGKDGINGFRADVFGMTIDYHFKDYQRENNNVKAFIVAGESTNYYNGNIASIRWNTNDGNMTIGDYQNAYTYYYNNKNWLEHGVYFKSNEVTNLGKLQGNYDYYTNYNYDKNGNITYLQRRGFDENAALLDFTDYNQGNMQLIDNLTYHYKTNSNQLEWIDDTVTGTTNADDIKDQNAGNYTYNEIGQLTHNTQDNVDYIYNTSGLVTEVKKGGTSLVKFYYSDKGQRERKESFDTSGTLVNTTHYVRDAAGSVMSIYTNGVQQENPVYGASRLGVYYKNIDNTIYQITDHLGNVRALISKDQNQNLVHHGNTDYYPGGMAMPGKNNQSAEGYRYGYQGEFAETDPETGKPAFQLRLYDSRINRWMSPDPYGQYHSPYMAMDNRPNMSVDPDGGCTDPPCDVDGGMLDEVIVRASAGNGRSMASYDFSSISDLNSNLGIWESSYTSLAAWNIDHGQNFNNSYQAYDWFLQQNQQQRTKEFVSSIHAAQREAGIFLLTTLSVINPWAFAFGGVSSAISIPRAGVQRIAYSYADDAISYSIRIHRAPAGGIRNLATGKIYKGGQFIPHSMKPPLNFGRASVNTNYLSNFAQSSASRPWPANAANASPFAKYLFPKLAVPVVYDRYQRHVNQ